MHIRSLPQVRQTDRTPALPLPPSFIRTIVMINGRFHGSPIVHRERIDLIFSTVLSQNSKLLVSAQLHPGGTKQLMSNTHLHSTLQHAFSQHFASPSATCAQQPLSRASCTHQQQRQWLIVPVSSEIEVGSTTFHFRSEHERKVSSILGVLSCISKGSYRTYQREAYCAYQGGGIVHARGVLSCVSKGSYRAC